MLSLKQNSINVLRILLIVETPILMNSFKSILSIKKSILFVKKATSKGFKSMRNHMYTKNVEGWHYLKLGLISFQQFTEQMAEFGDHTPIV